jgi:enterochelin esterase family protein
LDVIKELEAKGYENARLNDSFGQGKDIYYLELKDGRHDVETWGRALPAFLKWGWSN